MSSIDAVKNFEILVANYFGAKYGVATDSCTHAVELSLRYDSIHNVSCPNHTYLSIPMTLIKIGVNWTWNQERWKSYYFLDGTRIVDAAVLWKKNSYISGSLMCISFQFKKHLPIGRGGIILTDSYKEYLTLKEMSHDGRNSHMSWAKQDITKIGYHYYMTPESAEYGIRQFYRVRDTVPRQWSYLDYPDLSEMTVFNNGS